MPQVKKKKTVKMSPVNSSGGKKKYYQKSSDLGSVHFGFINRIYLFVILEVFSGR